MGTIRPKPVDQTAATQARIKLKSIIEKYKVKLTKEQEKEMRVLLNRTIWFDSTGNILLNAVKNLEAMLEKTNK